ncbi:hypothetical protein [Ekhidna sp.]|uniref:hypothetical protein n=1 Tax=Ekhidna sp. TaxID=2608089 RepID=UPI0032EF17CA
MTERKQLQKKLLFEYEDILNKSIEALDYSFNKCVAIGLKKDYTLDESETFEALTSRFARTSDIFTQKYLRCFFELIEEYPNTMIDMLNNAEKKGLINQTDALLDARKLRNDIAHEYWIENLKQKFAECLKLSPIMIGEVKNSFLRVREIVQSI